uniref:GAF domain-containing protein n=1 Tax=Anolis carolinensis TaxID=28377 RepID=H9G407_ANOCA
VRMPCGRIILDALLSLGSVIDISSLREVIKDAIASVLPKVERVYVYLRDGDAQLTCNDPPHELSQEGKLRDAVLKQKRVECNGLPPADLQGKPVAGLAAPLAPEKKGEARLGCVSTAERMLFGPHILVSYKRIQALQKLPQVNHMSTPSLEKAGESPKDSYNDQDRKILQLCGKEPSAAVLKQETHSPSCCLLLVSEDNHQLFCQVSPLLYLQTFHLTMGHLGSVVEQRKSITLQDISLEEHKQLNSMLGFEVTSMICVPVISKSTSQVVALACAFNKLGGESYTEIDERKIQHCFCYTSTVLTSTLAFQKEQKLKCECQALLQVAKNLFTHLDDVSVLLQEIITEARNLSNAEICSVFLLDRSSHELVAKVFDGGVVDDESYEIRIPADQGIAGHVATTGKILNIKDAYSHPLFYRGVDDSTGFRTRNILCFPIKDENQEVIGVAELVNKINGPWFSKFDEDLATAFSIYCGISIAHSLLYKKVGEAQYRSHLANEMMMYHMKVSLGHVPKEKHAPLPSYSSIQMEPPGSREHWGALPSPRKTGVVSKVKLQAVLGKERERERPTQGMCQVLQHNTMVLLKEAYSRIVLEDLAKPYGRIAGHMRPVQVIAVAHQAPLPPTPRKEGRKEGRKGGREKRKGRKKKRERKGKEKEKGRRNE